MHEPYQWHDSMPQFLKRLDSILDSVAGSALMDDPTPAPTVEPAAKAVDDATPGRNLKSKEVRKLLLGLPFKVAEAKRIELAREDTLSDAEQVEQCAASVDTVKSSSPADLVELLCEHGCLSGRSYTFDSLRMMIGRLIRDGKLPGWSGGKRQKAAGTDATNEIDVDAEFNPRKRRRAEKGDEDASPAVSIRKGIHKQASPGAKAARRGGSLSRDRQAVESMDQLTDAQRQELEAFWKQHPELEEG